MNTETCTVLLGIFIILSLILLPIFLARQVCDRIQLRVFRRKHAGHFFLVCTSKHGWYDFLLNNVIPILPDNIRVAWYNTKGPDRNVDLFHRLTQSKIYGLPKPYLVVVTEKRIQAKSLHGELQKLKTTSRKAEHVQLACRRLIESKQNELLTCG